MNFKTKCDAFLSDVTQMRATAIAQAVDVALQTQHEPYKAQLVRTRDEFVAAENEAFEKMVESLKKEHDKRVSDKVNATEVAIAEHKTSVTARAEASAKAEYDNFILGVSALVDKTKIN
jgi:PDZ domain-containing secreted protein